jgi:SAM-dependent methyltransferase
MIARHVQFGSGLSAPDGWVNYDASPTLRFERLPLVGRLYTRNAARFPATVRYGDIVKGLPERPGSVDALYSSHVLEHLALEDLRRALRNAHALLKPGGVFRSVLPDMEFEARRYLDDPSEDAVSRFMQETCLGVRSRPRGLGGLAASVLGNSQHLWMWDYKALAREMADAGFVSVRRANIGDAELAAFSSVEDPRRWTNCLGVECRRAI